MADKSLSISETVTSADVAKLELQAPATPDENGEVLATPRRKRLTLDEAKRSAFWPNVVITEKGGDIGVGLKVDGFVIIPGDVIGRDAEGKHLLMLAKELAGENLALLEDVVEHKLNDFMSNRSV
ncbi:MULTISPECIES: hypothetical protein [unclassified Bradyrhizobium]|uniref:hypothetical protein n=1 Tax=unclassified Bradyrhizobium TaxID=2631580 RepID=UPI003394B257